MTTIAPHPSKPWYLPTLSPEHGVYVMLAVSFLTGAEAAQRWTGATTLALICAYGGFQAEHPLSLQIKQRRSWKLRYVVWLSLYGGTAIAIAPDGCIFVSDDERAHHRVVVHNPK